MLATLDGLDLALQAETLLVQQVGHGVRAARCLDVVSSSASLRVDSVVQHNGDCGSPRRVGSTSASNAARNPGSVRVAVSRPPPARRTRPSGATPDSSSASPCEIRDRDAPVALATAAILPWPSERASPAITGHHQPSLALVQMRQHRLELRPQRRHHACIDSP